MAITEEARRSWSFSEGVAIAVSVPGIALGAAFATYPIALSLLAIIETGRTTWFGGVAPILSPLLVYLVYLSLIGGIVVYLRWRKRLPLGNEGAARH